MSATYSILAKGGGVEVLIYDDIGGSGISAKAFAEAFQTVPAQASILVRIDSDGGSVFDGMAIYNGLAARRAFVTCRIEGHAASMATVIACAASRVEMVANGLYMIHDPAVYPTGKLTEGDLRNAADLINKMRGQMIAIYAEKTKQKPEAIAKKMSATTWFTAQEAKDFGFVDAVIDAIQLNAKSDEFLARFPNAPKGVGSPEKTGAEASANKHPMKLLLAALAAARLIPSADLTDEAATAAFSASFVPMNTELENLRASHAESFKAKAEADVDACFADGRLTAKDDEAKKALRAGWVKAYAADPETTRGLLAGLVKPEATATTGPIVFKKTDAPAASGSVEALWAEHAKLKSPEAKTEFYIKNIHPIVAKQLR